ncbi:MAG TPA: autotransporter-associated beta strand repeat-containing protein [Opitutus sp.]|nr:autotransporter-associated beta strand repeat-containing protein [Opitutus sp.]
MKTRLQLLAFLVVLAGGPVVHAQLVWTGLTSGDAASVGNWNSIPNFTASTVVNFGNATNSALTINAGIVLKDLEFSADSERPGYSFSGTGSVTINGDLRVLGAGGDVEFSTGLPITLWAGGHAVNIANAGTTVTVNGAIGEIGGSASFTLSGAGTLVLGGSNTFTGGTTINGGILVIYSDAALGVAPSVATPGHLMLNGGTLRTRASFTLHANRGLALGFSGGTLQIDGGTTLTYGGTITAAAEATLVKTGDGRLVLNGTTPSNPQHLQINAGTVDLAAAQTLNAGTDITVGVDETTNAELAISANQELRALSGTGTVTIGGSQTLTINLPTAHSSTFDGQITGEGTFEKAGPGYFTLTGVNTYNGGTKISGGVLALNGGSISHEESDVFVGNAQLHVQNGGQLTANNGWISRPQGDYGFVSVDGRNSRWENRSDLYVGYQGSGHLNITGGAEVSASKVTVGTTAGSMGHIVVTGWSESDVPTFDVDRTPSTLAIDGDFTLGANFDGETDTSALGSLFVSEGGRVFNSGAATLGATTGAHGFAIIDGSEGGASWTAGSLTIGDAGSGFVLVQNGGKLNVGVEGDGTITLGANSAADSWSGGTLVIGADPWDEESEGAPAAGGVVNAAVVTTGTSHGNLVFNTDTSREAPYYFTKDGTADGAAVTISGNTQVQFISGYNVLKGQHDYTGATQIAGGTLAFANDDALPASSKLWISDGATLLVNFDQTIAGILNWAATEASIVIEGGQKLTIAMPAGGHDSYHTMSAFDGVISGDGELLVQGTTFDDGLLVPTLLSLGGANTFTGGTTLSSGILEFADGALGSGSVMMDGGQLRWKSGNSQDVSAQIVMPAGRNALFDPNGGHVTFANPIGGNTSASLTLSGYGTLTVSGSNTYTGTTTVTRGTLLVNHADALASALVQVGGATDRAKFGGIGGIAGSVNLLSNGGISAGGFDNIGTLSVGSAQFSGGSFIEFKIASLTGEAGTDWNLLNVSGTLTFDGTINAGNPITIYITGIGALADGDPTFTETSYQWMFATAGNIVGFDAQKFVFDTDDVGAFSIARIDNNLFIKLNPAAVPEPSTWALMITGLAIIGLGAWRRKK